MRSTLISLHQFQLQQENLPSKCHGKFRSLIRLSSFTTLCVLPLLVAPAAKAQAPAPPVADLPIPADIANNGTAAMQSLLTPRVDIEFQDIPVTDLLIQIAKMGGVEISIRGDVGGTLKFVRYKNVTAEQAIERVSDDAGLFWGKRGDQYVVARILEDLPYEFQLKYRNSAKSPNVSLNGGGVSRGNGGVAENPFPLPPVVTDQGIELQNGPNGTQRLPNSNNFTGIPELLDKEATKKRDKNTNVIKIKNVTARMVAHWLDPNNNPPDYWTERSNIAKAQANDDRTLVPVGGLEDYGLLNSAYGNRAGSSSPYPYPYAGQYPANNAYGGMPYGAPAYGNPAYGAMPYGASGYGSYIASPYVMQGMSNGQPFSGYNVPTAYGMQRGMQGDLSTYFNGIRGSGNQVSNSWSSAATNSNVWGQRPIYNPWAQPYIQASPQFGGRNGNGNGGRGNNNNGIGGRNGGIGGGGGNNQNAGVFELPEGIDSMVAIDAQNSLLVRGTAEAVEELQQLIELIDQPLKQVEIEAQFVTLTNADAKFFGIDFSGSALPFTITATTNPNNVSGNFNVGIVNRDFQATLNSLVTKSRAKIVTAPRVVAINNLTASLQSQTVTTVLLSQAAINAGNNNNNVVATAQVPFQIRTSIGITVAPTINGDGTITVLMVPQVQQQGTPTASNPIPTVSAQTVQTVAIVRDGDTIALGGLRNKSIQNTKQKIPFLGNIPILGKLFTSLDKSERDEDLIIFLTARVLHRLDDTTAVPGT